VETGLEYSVAGAVGELEDLVSQSDQLVNCYELSAAQIVTLQLPVPVLASDGANHPIQVQQTRLCNDMTTTKVVKFSQITCQQLFKKNIWMLTLTRARMHASESTF